MFWMKEEMRELTETKTEAERRPFRAVDGDSVGAATVAGGKETWGAVEPCPKVENFFAHPT